jgi:hypothetical protein
LPNATKPVFLARLHNVFKKSSYKFIDFDADFYGTNFAVKRRTLFRKIMRTRNQLPQIAYWHCGRMRNDQFRFHTEASSIPSLIQHRRQAATKRVFRKHFSNGLKLSILMPVFNEAQTIAAVVERVQAVPIDQEIVLVDDASSDGTAGIVDRLASHRVWVLHHPVNQGKGAAVRTALAAATGEVIVIQDADFEYDPNDFVRMMAPIGAGQAEVV